MSAAPPLRRCLTLLVLSVTCGHAAAIAAPTLSISNSSIQEGHVGSKSVLVHVTASEASDQPIGVRYRTRNVSAADSDYLAMNGFLEIPPGERVGSVAVIVLGDSIQEPEESLEVVLEDPINATLARAVGTVTIFNDDFSPRFVIDDRRVAEGDHGWASMEFSVRLIGTSYLPTQVDYTTFDGSARVQDGDYQTTVGTLVLPPYARSGVVSVPVRGDSLLEPDEYLSIRLSRSQGASISDAFAYGTLVNDDSAFPPRVTLLEPNGGEVVRVGDPVSIRWEATSEQDTITSVLLSITRDSGGSYEPLAGPIANTGTFLWDSAEGATGAGAEPNPSALLRVRVGDSAGLSGEDVSDAFFAIHDTPGRVPTSLVMVTPASASCDLMTPLVARVEPLSARGRVDFFADDRLIGSASLDPTGAAEVPYAAQPGIHRYRAAYLGDDSFAGSVSTEAVTEVVVTATSLALRAEPDSFPCTQTSRLIASLTPAATQGVVQFFRYGMIIGSVPVVDGAATFDVLHNTADPRPYSARFMGTSCYGPSAPDSLEVHGVRGSSAVTLELGADPEGRPGYAALAATMSPAIAMGEVHFFDGDVAVGIVSVHEGRAVLTLSMPGEGHHAYQCRYEGDACLLGSSSAVLVYTPGEISRMSVSDASVVESDCANRSLVFAVRLSHPSVNAVEVDYSTRDSTALGGSDFGSRNSSLAFPPWTIEQTVTISVYGDREPEGTEVLGLVLRNPRGAIIDRAVGIGTIEDNDPSPPAGSPHFIQQWGARGDTPGLFNYASTIAASATELFVGDRISGRLQVFDLRGVYRRIFPTHVGTLSGLAVGPNGNLYSAGDYLMKEWTPLGEIVRTWGTYGTAEGQFTTIKDLAIHPVSGEIFVVSAPYVHRMTAQGDFIARWPVPDCYGLACDADGFVYVLTFSSIHKYTAEGLLVGGWSLLAGNCGVTYEPPGICVAPSGHIFVTSTHADRVCEFTSNGTLVAWWGQPGSAPGQFSDAVDVAVDSFGCSYVVDFGNHRVQKFGPPDIWPPAMSCPSDTTIACGPSGAIVHFAPIVEDDRDSNPRIECVPASGSVFPVGTTRVVCTATDSSGNRAQCAFDVHVEGAACPEARGVRIGEIALGCANGDTTAQFIELVAEGEGLTLSGSLVLQVHDRTGVLTFQKNNMFGERTGEPWPAGKAWLIGTAGLEAAALAPDLEVETKLDLLGGVVTISSPGPAGYEVVDRVVYGMQGGPDAPLLGGSLRRDAGGTMIETPTPDPTRFDGDSAVGLNCPCPINELRSCGTSRTSEPRFIHKSTCGAARYDLVQGTLHASGHGRCPDHHSSGSATVTVNDVYYVVGPLAGTPVDLTIRYRLSMWTGACQLGEYGYSYGVANGSIRMGDSLFRASKDTTIALHRTVPARQPFRLDMQVHGSGLATGSSTAYLSFADLPQGASIVSCQGFLGDVVVPTLVAIERVETAPGRLAVTWMGTTAAGRPGIVHHADESGAWVEVATRSFDADGRLRHEEEGLVPGSRHGYRLHWETSDGEEIRTEETWAVVPATAEFALEAPSPNPSTGDVSIRFSLRGALAARLDVIDVAGRSRFSKDLGGLGAGSHLVRVRDAGLLPGLYFVRLTEGDLHRVRRVFVIR